MPVNNGGGTLYARECRGPRGVYQPHAQVLARENGGLGPLDDWLRRTGFFKDSRRERQYHVTRTHRRDWQPEKRSPERSGKHCAGGCGKVIDRRSKRCRLCAAQARGTKGQAK
jgi:hypothetical protein